MPALDGTPVADATPAPGRRRAAPEAGGRRWLVWVLGTVGAVLAFGLARLVSGLFFDGPPEPRALPSECLAGSTDRALAWVGCDEASARWRVVGKLDGVPEQDYAANQQLCSAYPTTERIFWEAANRDERGYALCLEPARQ